MVSEINIDLAKVLDAYGSNVKISERSCQDFGSHTPLSRHVNNGNFPARVVNSLQRSPTQNQKLDHSGICCNHLPKEKKPASHK